jgi:hypothetical protein
VKTPEYNSFKVHGAHSNPQQAAAILERLNKDGLNLMQYLRGKYLIQGKGSEKAKKFVAQLVERYNFENIIESSPLNIEGETSYSVDKGRELYVCLRDKAKNSTFHDYNLLLFVFLHELSHIGNPDYGHGDTFWIAFKFVLENAVEIGIYTPVDYQSHPISYCNGLVINHQPLFDSSIPSL